MAAFSLKRLPLGIRSDAGTVSGFTRTEAELNPTRCDHGTARWGGTQLISGDVVFTHGATMAKFTSPLAKEESIVAPRAEYAGAIAETASGAWLMSTRPSAGTHYALKLWKPNTSLSGAGRSRHCGSERRGNCRACSCCNAYSTQASPLRAA